MPVSSGGGRGRRWSQSRVFCARGQLRMLNSLGMSSPLCCWSVFRSWLLHWSPSLPAFPALRITWSERRGRYGLRGGGECSFILCGLMGRKKQYSPPMLALLNKVHIKSVSEVCWNGTEMARRKVNKVSHSQSVSQSKATRSIPPRNDRWNLHRGREKCDFIHWQWFPITLPGQNHRSPSPSGEDADKRL